jgi:hypothetical protein
VFIEVKFATRFDSPACLDIFDAEMKIINNQTLYVSTMCRNDKKLLKYELTLDLYGLVQPFEVDPEVMTEWKKISEAFDVKWAEFVKLNETYDDDLKDFEGDHAQYEADMEDQKKDDPYGDENVPVKPVKPTKPVTPVQPPASPVSVFGMQSVGRVYFNLTKPEPLRWKKLIPEMVTKRPQNMGVWWELYEKYERDLVALEPFEDDDEDIKKAAKKEKKDKEKTPKTSKKSKVKINSF